MLTEIELKSIADELIIESKKLIELLGFDKAEKTLPDLLVKYAGFESRDAEIISKKLIEVTIAGSCAAKINAQVGAVYKRLCGAAETEAQ